jgi:hypothetical protein
VEAEESVLDFLGCSSLASDLVTEVAMTRPCLLRFGSLFCRAAALCSLIWVTPPALAQFETRATTALPNESFAVAAGDFNHDGKLDVAVMGDYLSILLGNGDGTFRVPINYTGVGQWVAAADFNNDGNLDIVTANVDNSVSVFLGNGDGTFQTSKLSHTTNNCTFVVVGDFNGDHKMDIAVVDNPYVSILLGNGDGTFQTPIDNNSFVGAHQLATADFNHDHRLDVVAVGYFGGTQNFGILLGSGDGTLQSSLTYPLIYAPSSVAVADFNGDGNPDLAIEGNFDSDISVLLGNGDGSFQPETDYPILGGGDVLVRDFNADGKLDIVSGVSELLGNGDGTFQSPGLHEVSSGSSSGGPEAAADLNGDGMPDLVYLFLVTGAGDAVQSALNTGRVTFTPETPITFPTQLIGRTSSLLSATLTNNGSSPLTISSVSYSGKPFHVQTSCKGTIAPSASCSITATFTPQVEDVSTGTVTIHDNASSKPQVVELEGTGTVVKFAPAQLVFPPQKKSTKSPAKTVVLTNTSSVPLVLSRSIYVGGPDTTRDFFESNNCPTTINAGSSCTIHVIFSPQRTGPLDASIVVTDNGGGSPQIVPLSGTGD